MAAVAALTWSAGDATAGFEVYSFTNITGNSAANAAAGEAQLSVTVSDEGVGANQVKFTFNNAGPAASSIAEIYFDDGTLLGISSITNGPGVDFEVSGATGNLPGGNGINFNESAGFTSVADNPAPSNGVNPGEFVTITFDLLANQDFQDVIDALELGLDNPGEDVTGGLRIGIHVTSFAGGGSESFVNGPPDEPQPPVIPAPPTVILAGIGVLGFGGLARLRRRFTTTA